MGTREWRAAEITAKPVDASYNPGNIGDVDFEEAGQVATPSHRSEVAWDR